MIKKIIITILSILVVGMIGSYLYFLEALTSKSILGSIFVLTGMILLVIGQIMMVNELWRDKNEITKR